MDSFKNLTLNETNWNEYSYETRTIHSGNNPDQWDSLAVVPPIVLSTTFKQHEPTSFNQLSATDDEGYEYGRCSNPSRSTLEKNLAPLEKAKYALAFSSGMSAITSLIYLLKTGDHVITIDDVYSGSCIFFKKYVSRMGIEVSFVNMLDLEETEKSFRPNTAMVWIEATTNPTLKMTDIRAVCEMAKKKNPKILIGCDNTFSSPYFLNPLELGVDIVMHSATKYLGGHSDVIMGAVMVNDIELYERIKDLQIVLGGVPSPFDCFLMCRSLKTFPLRMQKHMSNGYKIAEALENNPRIEKVLYPGLKSYPQHELFKKQMSGYSGMMSFYIKSNIEGVKVFLKALKIVKLAVSLGGFESLIEHPAIMTHRFVAEEEREKLGIKDNFFRMSIGLEDANDLINDIDQALKIVIPTV